MIKTEEGCDELRGKLLLSQSATARILGYSHGAVSRWEHGSRDMPRLARLVLRYLVLENETKKPPTLRKFLQDAAEEGAENNVEA